MIKTLKISLSSLTAFSLLFFTGASSVGAAALDLVWNADQTISIASPAVSLTILSGSTAESLVVNTDSLVPTLTLSNIFTVTSAVGGFTVSPISGVVSTACSSASVATLTIRDIASSQAFTITPNTTLCTPVATGGGGGGGYIALATTVAVTPAVTTATTPVVVATTPVTPAVPATPAVPGKAPAIPATPASPALIAATKAITVNLSVGKKGTGAKTLQQFLNSQGFVVAVSGAGSPGKETTLFGNATKAALAKWQKSVGISPATGDFGPKTRAFIKKMQ